MESTKTVTARTGSDVLSITTDPTTQHARIHFRHTDDFNGEDDLWVTLGEFRSTEIIAALLPPAPAAQHAALQHPQRPFWRRKRDHR